jgi:hypothetical protein
MKRASVFPIFVATSLLLLVIAATAPFAVGASQSTLTSAKQAARNTTSSVIDVRSAHLLFQVSPALRGVSVYLDDQFQGITGSEGRLLVPRKGGITTLREHALRLDINGKQCVVFSFLFQPEYRGQTTYYGKDRKVTFNLGLPDSCTTTTKEPVLGSTPSGDPQQVPSGKSVDSGPSDMMGGKHTAPQRTRSAPYTPTGILLLHPDYDCTVKIDGAVVAQLKKGDSRPVKVRFGQHLVEADASGSLHWESAVEVRDSDQIVLAIPLQAAADQAATFRTIQAGNAAAAAAALQDLKSKLEYFQGSWKYGAKGGLMWDGNYCEESTVDQGTLNLQTVDLDKRQISGTLSFSRLVTITRDEVPSGLGDPDCSIHAYDGAAEYSGQGAWYRNSENWQIQITCQFGCKVTGQRTACSGECPPTWNQEIGDVLAYTEPEHFSVLPSPLWEGNKTFWSVEFVRSR